MTDGSSTLYFLNPSSLAVTKQLEVYDNHGHVNYLNELEYINGEIYANIYLTDNIVRIDPETGKVLGIVNLTGILKPKDRDNNTEVLNGIAYDSESNRLFVTGKYWSKLFEINLVEK